MPNDKEYTDSWKKKLCDLLMIIGEINYKHIGIGSIVEILRV